VFTEQDSGNERGAMNERPGDGLMREYGRYMTKSVPGLTGGVLTLITVIGLVTSRTFRHWAQVFYYPNAIYVVMTLGLALPTLAFFVRRHRMLTRAVKGREIAGKKSAEALALLDLLSFFASGPVDEDLLQADVLAPDEVFRRILSDPDSQRRAAVELSHASLAEIDGRNRRIRVRSIVQAMARGQLSREDPALARALGKLAQSILAASDPGTPDRDDAEEQYRRSRRHLIPSGATLSPDHPVRRLVINQIRRLYREGRYIEAVELGWPALDYWREAFGCADRQTLQLAVAVGWALRRLGRWEEAMRLNRDTLERLTSLFGSDDQDYLLCARSFGIDLALLGDYAKARDHDLDLLPSYERVFGCRHLETLHVCNDIAICLRCLGDFERALEFDRFTFAQRQEDLGDDDTGTLTSQFAIARDLRMLGQIPEAHDMLAGVVSALARRRPRSQQFELVAGADLIVSLRRYGRYPEALAQGERICRQHESVYGLEHRETLRAEVNFINDLRIAGRLRDARTLGERIVAGWISVAGPDHPNTLAARANLASVLRAGGNPSGALRIDDDLVARFTALFGEVHPSTLAVQTNMASDLAMMEEATRARQAGERSYRLHAETRGHDHPATLATAANLSLDRRRVGDHTGADDLRASTLRAYATKLGVDHPETQLATQYGRVILDIEPMMD
jgi:tetratricopeptide (TPR) repeat protein